MPATQAVQVSTITDESIVELDQAWRFPFFLRFPARQFDSATGRLV
jgi:hypothetical protein